MIDVGRKELLRRPNPLLLEASAFLHSCALVQLHHLERGALLLSAALLPKASAGLVEGPCLGTVATLSERRQGRDGLLAASPVSHYSTCSAAVAHAKSLALSSTTIQHLLN